MTCTTFQDCAEGMSRGYIRKGGRIERTPIDFGIKADGTPDMDDGNLRYAGESVIPDQRSWRGGSVAQVWELVDAPHVAILVPVK